MATLTVSGLLEVEVVREAGVLAVEHGVGGRRREGRSVRFGLHLRWLLVDLTVEVNVAHGWLCPGLALALHFLPPEAEEEESRGYDDEEAAGGETEGEEAVAGGDGGSERNNLQSPLLAAPSLTGPAGDIAPVLRGGSHCDSLGHGDQVGPGVLHQDLNINITSPHLT